MQQLTIDGTWETQLGDLKPQVYSILHERPELRSNNKAHLIALEIMKKHGMGAVVTEDQITVKRADFSNLLRMIPSVERYIRSWLDEYARR